MQAIILAAGMGKRLKELTNNSTKCMVKVNGVTMIERMLRLLDKKDLSKIVIVVGYEGQKLVDYVNTLSVKTPVVFVNNPIYDKTNNIYSLYLAKDYLLQEDTLLLESDLVFEEAVLDRILSAPYPTLTLVAKFESWMDGTVVELDDDDNILRFRSKKEFHFSDTEDYYKTVNIYKFAKEFSASHYVPFLEAYIKALGDNEYYEQVLKVIALLDKPIIKAVRLENEKWYEIDDIQDLNIAESIFADREHKLRKFQQRYGGYWRYPKMLDFCYLVNPFFPSRKLADEMKANFDRLLQDYPSGMGVNSLLAAKCFGLHPENVVVGNGAAELIKSLMESFDGKVGVVFPTFEEYPNRLPEDRIVPFFAPAPDFHYTVDDLMAFYDRHPVQMLTLVNPDNPSGCYSRKADVLRLAEWAGQKGIRLVVDESFADFVDEEADASLLKQELLKQYPQLAVMKSISKSYGVPGLRLGVLACGDEQLIAAMKKDVAIWNINSFAEFFLQIYEKYRGEYQAACRQFYDTRTDFVRQLSGVAGLKIVPSQANYVLCEVLPPHSSHALARDLLYDDNIFIKDLSTKKGFNGADFIRVAVRTPEDNRALVDALHRHLA